MSERLADVLSDVVLSDVARLLHAGGVGFAVVGGLAVSARTEPRFTRDVAIAVAVDDEAGVGGRRRADPPFRVVSILEHGALARTAAMRVRRAGTPTVGVVVDRGVRSRRTAVGLSMRRATNRGRDLLSEWRELAGGGSSRARVPAAGQIGLDGIVA